MEPRRILLVDDELEVLLSLEGMLERNGFRVLTARSGEEALHKVQTFAPDLVLLDIKMPGMSGRAVLRELRQDGDWPPVIMLTQVQGADERSMTLDEGADDYVNKPCDAKELVSRIRAVLRRCEPGAATFARAHEVRCGDVRLDRRRRRAYLKGRELSLGPKAFGLLEYLMLHPGEVCTREQLLDEVWGWDYPSGPRTVDSHIADLRRALRDHAGRPRYVETAVGQGYRFLGKVEVIR
jgi:DNA-binding response OmpR family regulator